MADAALRSQAVVLLLLTCCLVCFPLVVEVLCLSLLCCALLYIHSSFAIIWQRKRELVALLLLSNGWVIYVGRQMNQVKKCSLPRCPGLGSNSGRWIRYRSLYRLDIKAGLYSKAVQVLKYLPLLQLLFMFSTTIMML